MDDVQQDLVGRVAVITGATSGIGFATAVHLAARGAEVVLTGRDVARGGRALAKITEAGGHGRFVAADLATRAGVDGLTATLGSVDILVNNAGIAWYGPTADIDADTLDQLFAANVRSAYLLTAAVAPGMTKRGDGVIVNVSSTAASIGMAGAAAYSGSKAALEGMTRSWAAEFGPHGVRVVAVSPGPIHTSDSGRDRKDALGATTILGRAGSPDEIAAVIGFLTSGAASYLTGAVVPVDAGRSVV